MLKIDILTIFPEFFTEVFDFGIIRRAREARLVEVKCHDLRTWANDKHRKVDDRPFGGGSGMVLKAEPIFSAVEELVGTTDRDSYPDDTNVVLLSPQGEPFKQDKAKNFAKNAGRVILICGRYEGVDERVNESLVTEEISIGDYVLSGGEPAAVVVADSVIRLLPNALGNEMSAESESFSDGMLDFPTYTQPREFLGKKVPDVLFGGNHGEIEKWRSEKALEKTKRIRRDLLDEE